MPFLSASGMSPYNKIRGGALGPAAIPFAFNNALEFDGVNDFVQFDSTISFLRADIYTINLWFIVDDFSGMILANSALTNTYFRVLNSTTIRTSMSAFVGDFTVPTITLGTWNMLTITRDGTESIRCYLNGVQSSTPAKVIPRALAVDRLGGYPSGSFQLDGRLDEVGILKGTTATQTDVDNLYNGGAGQNFTTVMGSSDLNYHLDESVTATTAVDSSGNGNDGTLNNFPTSGMWVDHYTGLSLESSMVASWSFDANFSDYIGNNNLTANGNATAGVAGGIVDNCAELDGTSDYAIAVDSDDLSFTDGATDLPFSVSFWANFDTFNNSGLGGVWMLSKRGSTATNEEYQITFLEGKLYVYLFSSLAGDNIFASCTFQPTIGGTTWNNFGFTYDGNETAAGIKIYVDGVSQTVSTGGNGTYTGMQNSTSTVNIGSAGFSPDAREFDGKLDEFHIWKNRELTSSEVLSVYDRENGGESILPARDPDAQAYITAGSITDATEIAAINKMFLDLKGTGSTTNNSNIYSKFSALYLMSPTSLAAASINAVTPSTYDITWYNSPTHSVNGVVGNGSNQYGDTGLNAFSVLNQNDCGITVSLNTSIIEVGIEMGARDGTSKAFELVTFNSNGMYARIATFFGQMIDAYTPYNNVYTGIRRGANDSEMYREGVSVVTSAAASSAMPNETLYILAENIVGFGANAPSTKRTVFNAVHQSFTDNEAKDLYDAITTYNANVISGGR